MEKEIKMEAYPKFEDIKVSTKTYITTTNIQFDLEKLYDFLPITPYILVKKRRGRKTKATISKMNEGIQEGSIITLKFGNKTKGVILKPKKNDGPKSFFRNCVMVVMVLDKNISVKITRNGKLHLTGCKNKEHVIKVIQHLWNYIKDNKTLYTIAEPVLNATIMPVMRNIDFSLGFNVNRENLDRYINASTDYNSLLETSFGYTGVNIKFPLGEPPIHIRHISFDLTDISKYSVKEEYVVKDCAKKPKSNTFLVFHSGRVISSGQNSKLMRPSYYEFLSIVEKSKDFIVERLD